MSRPNEIVEWAEDSSAQTSEPTNERAGGFPFRYTPPAEQINWMWRAVGRWITWLHLQVRTFQHLDDFVAQAQPGEIALINNYDPNKRPGESISSVVTRCGSLGADARYILEAGDEVVTIKERRDLNIIVGTFNTTKTSSEIKRIVVNGKYALVSSISKAMPHTGEVECFDYSNPASPVSLWTKVTNPSEGTVSMAITSKAAFVIMGGTDVKLFDIEDGTLLGTYTHTHDVIACTCFGYSVYVSTLNQKVLKLTYVSGGLNLAWAADVVGTIGDEALVCDAHRVFAVHGDTGVLTNKITVLTAAGAKEMDEYVWVDSAGIMGGAHVVLDANYLIIARRDGYVDVVDKRTLGIAMTYDVGGSYVRAVETDGAFLFVSVHYNATNDDIVTAYPNPSQMPRRYLRVEPSAYLPYQKLAIQLGE